MGRKRTTGWEAYRYGRSDQPKPQHKPIFNKDKRRHVIDTLFNAMADWRFSPFQFEGVTRSHLRASLCLQGYGWGRADAEAADILAEVLKGYQRPSWQEGQPSYTASIVTCRGCGGPLDEYEISHGIRYCSAECQRIGKLKSTGLAAGFVESGPKRCSNPKCSTVFFPKDSFTRFCSRDCYLEGRSLELPRRDCAFCGTEFQPANTQALYCSDLCHNRGRDRIRKERREDAREERACLHCRSRFYPKKSDAKYCSQKCQRNASYHRQEGARRAAARMEKAAKSDHPIHKLFDDAA